MLPLEKLEQLTRRYTELDELMCRPEVLTDRNQLSKLTKERSDLEALVSVYGRYRDVHKKLKEDEEALTDPRLPEPVERETPEPQASLPDLEKKIQVLLPPADPNEKKNVILEIRGGEGGEEAALFAADLFRMYGRYA